MNSQEKKEYSPEKRRYNMDYAKTSLKRIPLDVQLWQYEKIKKSAEAAGEPINTYIKNAIQMRMQTEKE